MSHWIYEIRDRDTDKVIVTGTGFCSESDAEIHARFDAAHRNIKNFYIRTVEIME